MCYKYQDYEHGTQDYRWQPATAARSNVHIKVQQPTTSLLRLFVAFTILSVPCGSCEVVAGDPGSLDRRGLHNAS